MKSVGEEIADACEEMGIPIIRSLLVPPPINWREIFSDSLSEKVKEDDSRGLKQKVIEE